MTIKDYHEQDIEDVLKWLAICKKPAPEDKELEYFYKSCAETIYVSCSATMHDIQAKILLEEAADERKTEAKSVIESKKEKAEQLRKKIFKIDERCAKIQEEVDGVERKVQNFADNMIDWLLITWLLSLLSKLRSRNLIFM